VFKVHNDRIYTNTGNIPIKTTWGQKCNYSYEFSVKYNISCGMEMQAGFGNANLYRLLVMVIIFKNGSGSGNAKTSPVSFNLATNY
jgi:hypothetical protein